ncbi:hypothetical protein LKD70_09260 [Ruminococcus sp. CLA-AA-H200]|uniref:Uncharacterized protein n=1 Tax=Ruminococcus turbiniformis TaxID=2881258 RepID=A0ABS8FXA4_9FIRM|nr:hypothetical protein [Ruminococcus turbiniformis]MCC2254603.1 hypothetical protein [Ruminococcus turbiniformis]
MTYELKGKSVEITIRADNNYIYGKAEGDCIHPYPIVKDNRLIRTSLSEHEIGYRMKLVHPENPAYINASKEKMYRTLVLSFDTEIRHPYHPE